MLNIDHSLRSGRALHYWNGKEVPISRLKPPVVLAHDVAEELVRNAHALRDMLQEQKFDFYNNVDAYTDLLMEHYGARLGGSRSGLTIENFASTKKVVVSSADRLQLTAAMEAAKAIVSEIVDDLAQGSSDDLRAILASAFDRDEKTGRISIERVLALRRLNLSHPKWPQAQDAIGDAIQVAGSKRYIRFYERARPADEWQQINLNFSNL